MRPYILAETNWKTVKDTDYETAVLPWGATEAHNFHLPYSTDVIEADYIAGESAKIAWEKGARVIVLPTVPFGVNTGQHDVKLDMNINPSTQLIILKDLIEVLNRQGIHKLVILNSHGGNDFRQMIRELNLIFPDMFICQCHWFKIAGAEHLFEDLGEHAGEVETSIMQHIAPGLTLPMAEAGDGKAKSFKIKAFSEGWAWAEREWTKVTDDTGIGNPAKASPEKGKKFLEFVTGKIGNFLYDISKADKNNLYE